MVWRDCLDPDSKNFALKKKKITGIVGIIFFMCEILCGHDFSSFQILTIKDFSILFPWDVEWILVAHSFLFSSILFLHFPSSYSSSLEFFQKTRVIQKQTICKDFGSCTRNVNFGSAGAPYSATGLKTLKAARVNTCFYGIWFIALFCIFSATSQTPFLGENIDTLLLFRAHRGGSDVSLVFSRGILWQRRLRTASLQSYGTPKRPVREETSSESRRYSMKSLCGHVLNNCVYQYDR